MSLVFAMTGKDSIEAGTEDFASVDETEKTCSKMD
jgi:hypothetical protein